MNIQLGVICADMVDFCRPGHICYNMNNQPRRGQAIYAIRISKDLTVNSSSSVVAGLTQLPLVNTLRYGVKMEVGLPLLL